MEPDMKIIELRHNPIFSVFIHNTFFTEAKNVCLHYVSKTQKKCYIIHCNAMLVAEHASPCICSVQCVANWEQVICSWLFSIRSILVLINLFFSLSRI